jgi:hypothetical protein
MVIFDKLFGGLRTKRQEKTVFPELPEFARLQISAYASPSWPRPRFAISALCEADKNTQRQ